MSELDTKVLDAIIAKLDQRAEGIVKEAAFSVLAGAQLNAPVDTGALQNSLNAEQESRLMFRVQDGVNYGVFQELGTYKMAAHPFLVPGVEMARQPFLQKWGELFKP